MAKGVKSNSRKPRPFTGRLHRCLHILDSITYFRVSTLLDVKEHPRCGWTVLRPHTCSSNQYRSNRRIDRNLTRLGRFGVPCLENDLIVLPINTIPFQPQQFLFPAPGLNSKVNQIHKVGRFLINRSDQFCRLLFIALTLRLGLASPSSRSTHFSSHSHYPAEIGLGESLGPDPLRCGTGRRNWCNSSRYGSPDTSQ